MIVPWNNIDTVLLDMDGTILDLHFDNYFWLNFLPQKYAEQNQLSFEQARGLLTKQFDAIRGTLNWYCLDYWTEQIGMDVAELKKTIGQKVAFRPYAIEFLSFLNQQQKQVVLVTNAHFKSLEIKLLNTQFHQYFNHLISSHEFKAPKEEQSFWQQLQVQLNFNKQRTVFIDDSLSILQSAQKFGIRYLYGIAQPDSQQPPRTMAPFIAIEDFRQIISTS